MSSVRPLHQAIEQRNLAAAQAALERDASQATEPLPGGLSPLMFALYNGAHDIAALLREFNEGALSLYEAAALGDAHAVAAAVLAQPESVRDYSVDGWTALHLAAFFGTRNAAFVLMGLGAPLDAVSRNPSLNTPLHAAIAGAGGEALAPLLIAFGADVRAVGGDGITPLHLAAVRGFDNLCRLLVARGAERRAQTTEGKTPAGLARERGHMAVAAFLDGQPS